MSKLFLLAILLGAGCSTFKVGDDQNNPPPTDAVYQPPPPRQVYDDGPVAPPSGGSGGEPGTGGAGGMASPDAGVIRDAASPADKPVGQPDAPIGEPDAPASADVAAVGCVACDLLGGGCPSPGQACYPSGAGRGCCAFPEAPVGVNQFCTDRLMCDVGQACVGGPDNSFCRVLCDPAKPFCTGCTTLGGYPGVGYCPP